MRELAPVAEEKDGANIAMVKALSHPTRLGIMVALQGRIASPVELAREMNKSAGVISYHASTLVNCGCLEVVEVEPRRGTFERFFGVAPDSAI
jgi:DNA-binding transcriptional ArsR family regulator